MNPSAVEQIANAVLYEGYLLYPYRRSAVKNRQRFNFGVLYPEGFGEASEMRVECLATGDAPVVEAKIRFLQLMEREDWQEGRERDVTLKAVELRFDFDDAVAGLASLSIEALGEGLFKVVLTIRNRAQVDPAIDRDGALLRSMVSTHSILHITGGEFVSLLDPPAALRDAAASCTNSSAWPVLVGDEGERNMMLASPIILYDFPQIAPESPGDLFDGTEIDEILALRILTMTDDEKREVREGDPRAREILDRTEMMPQGHFQKLHGALRGLDRK
jgi:hypothetical protein